MRLPRERKYKGKDDPNRLTDKRTGDQSWVWDWDLAMHFALPIRKTQEEPGQKVTKIDN